MNRAERYLHSLKLGLNFASSDRKLQPATSTSSSDCPSSRSSRTAAMQRSARRFRSMHAFAGEQLVPRSEEAGGWVKDGLHCCSKRASALEQARIGRNEAASKHAQICCCTLALRLCVAKWTFSCTFPLSETNTCQILPAFFLSCLVGQFGSMLHKLSCRSAIQRFPQQN